MGLFEILEPIKYKDTRSQYHTISMAGSVLLASTDTENQVRFTRFLQNFLFQRHSYCLSTCLMMMMLGRIGVKVLYRLWLCCS